MDDAVGRQAAPPFPAQRGANQLRLKVKQASSGNPTNGGGGGLRRAAKSSRGVPADIPHIRPPIRSFASSAAGDGTGGGGLGARSARLRGIGVLGKDFLASASARKSVDRRDVELLLRQTIVIVKKPALL